MYSNIIDFIRELYDTPKGRISLHEPRFIGNEKKYVMDAIDSTFVSSVGTYVDTFEEMITEISRTRYAIAVVNGTSALHIALRLVGVEAGEEVICQPLTFVATANAICYENAIPHFIDVDEDSLGMSPVILKKFLEEKAKVKNNKCFNTETGNRIAACVPMHTFGLPMRIDEIVSICDDYHIPVVEDAAESLGSYYKGFHTGSFGLMGVFSFNGNKTVTCGGGGAIITNNKELAAKAKHVTTTAKVPHRWEYVHDQIGFNYRMPNLNAALACGQLEQLEYFIKNKRETSEAYCKFFKNFEQIEYIESIECADSNYWLNAIRFENENARNIFLEYSNSNGVMTRPVWQLLNRLQMFKSFPKGDLSTAEKLANTVVNIPSSVRII